MKRLVALELLALAGLADVGTFLLNSPATIATQESNPIMRTLGWGIGILVVRLFAIGLVATVVTLMARLGRWGQVIGMVAVALGILIWGFGAWTNVTNGGTQIGAIR